MSAQDVRDFLLSVFTLATKGDLAGIDAAGLRQALNVGPDGEVLTADTASTLGFKWAAAGAGAHPDLATHDALGLATDAELATHTALPNAHHAQSHGNGDHTTAFTDDTTVNAHLADAVDAHDASAISVDSTTLVGTGTDVQAVFEEMDNDIAALKLPDYLVGTATATLSGEIVVGTSPGGELGGTWASPTVDATHSGSAHHTTHDSDDVAYIPASNADWGGSDPGDVEQALDVLADRTSKVMLWIPAKDLIPSYDRAAYTGVPGVNTVTTNDWAYRFLAFGNTADQYAAFDFATPPNWDAAATITARFRWLPTGGSAGDTAIWGIRMVCIRNDDVLDTAMGSAVTVTDTVTATTDLHISDFTTAITPGGTLGAGGHMFCEVYRSVSDTLASTVNLVGIDIVFTLTAAGVA